MVAALEDHRQRPVRFLNAGKGGANSRYGLKIAPSLAEGRPDLVSVEFAVNDADIRSAMPPAESERNMRIIIEEFRSSNPRSQVFVILTHQVIGLRRWIRPFLELYLERHRLAAESMGATVIDLRRALDPYPAGPLRLILPDGLHLTSAGFVAAVAPSIVSAMTLS